MMRRAVKKGRSVGDSPPMRTSSSDEVAGEQPRRQAADPEVALQKAGGLPLGEAAQRRAEVDAEQGDERDGEDEREGPDDAANDTPHLPPAGARGGLRSVGVWGERLGPAGVGEGRRRRIARDGVVALVAALILIHGRLRSGERRQAPTRNSIRVRREFRVLRAPTNRSADGGALRGPWMRPMTIRR